MSAPVFIGDELTATGFRLAGIETLTPPPAKVREVFAQARQRANVVVLTAEFAELVPAAELSGALLAEAPIVMIVPDILDRTPPPDLTRRLRATLGIEN